MGSAGGSADYLEISKISHGGVGYMPILCNVDHRLPTTFQPSRHTE